MIDPIADEQINRLNLKRGTPLIAVDADEVLVFFLSHFRDWVGQRGWTLDLTTKRLDTALRQDATGRVADRGEAWGFLEDFFREEALSQRPIERAAQTLEDLSKAAQIIVLTNIPHFAREDRVRNLAGHGHRWPVITNSGGKGHALAMLYDKVEAPIFFIDDSASQIDSAAKHAPDTIRLQLVGCPWAAPFLPASDAAHARVAHWADAGTFVQDRLRRARP